MLSAYFQPSETDEIRAMQLSWWCDELQDWTHDQTVWGLRKWNRENPRLRPTPGDIVGILKAERGRQKAMHVKELMTTREQDGEIVSAESAARILAEVGFVPRGFRSIASYEAELRRSGVLEHVEAAADAIRAVCEEFGLTFADLRGRNRDAHHVAARDKAIRAMNDAGMSTSQIGKAINRDPSSVSASLARSEAKA